MLAGLLFAFQQAGVQAAADAGVHPFEIGFFRAAIGFTGPISATVLAALVLGETVRLRRLDGDCRRLRLHRQVRQGFAFALQRRQLILQGRDPREHLFEVVLFRLSAISGVRQAVGLVTHFSEVALTLDACSSSAARSSSLGQPPVFSQS